METINKYNIHYFEQLDSTNDYALRNKEKLVFGDVIVANQQTHGHGRFARKWYSENINNIYMTIVLGNISQVSSISLYASIILIKSLEFLGVNATIKWPNDIMLEGKKIAGLLVQNIYQGKTNFAIVGIGLNIDLSEKEKIIIDNKVISLKDIGINIEKESLISIILENFFDFLEEFLKRGFSMIKKEYTLKSSLLGKEITVKCLQKNIFGKVVGFSDTGEIIIKNNENIENIFSGEVVKVL
jgi:BirA family transcriptional regulator, biotin operon repressor / biotin---[acetyl-CoA-carboxylase] ligase